MSMRPFRGRGFYDMHSEMNRLFDEVLGGLARRGGRQQSSQPSQWSPALDVLQENGDMVIRAELPGVKPEDVDITLERGVLTISGERKAEEERRGAGYFVRERRHGSFRRSMQLPEGVDENSINARYQDGVLEVKVTGIAAVQEPRRIQIKGPTGAESSGTTMDVDTGGPGTGGVRAEGGATPGGATPEEGSSRTEGPSPTAR